MSDTIVVMNQGYIQQIGSPEDIYNEPVNAFVADFIGESNIFPATMIEDKLVEIFGVRFPCVDTGFGRNKPVDVVIRPEDIDLIAPQDGTPPSGHALCPLDGSIYRYPAVFYSLLWLNRC